MPISLAFFRTSTSFTFSARTASNSTTSRSICTNSITIFVASAISSFVAPFLIASHSANSLSSVGVAISTIRSSLDQSLNFFISKWSTPISRPRTAFSIISSMDWPRDITSPVAFICVDSLLEADVNLSNGKRATLATL